jgi:hypothetical protein
MFVVDTMISVFFFFFFFFFFLALELAHMNIHGDSHSSFWYSSF